MTDVNALIYLGTLVIFIFGALSVVLFFIVLSVVFLPVLLVWQRRKLAATHRLQAEEHGTGRAAETGNEAASEPQNADDTTRPAVGRGKPVRVPDMQGVGPDSKAARTHNKGRPRTQAQSVN